jgi:hypothetical protein
MEHYIYVLKNSHRSLANRLSRAFINLVTKDPIAKDLLQVLDNLKSYIGPDFISKPVEIALPDPNDLLNPKIEKLDYFTYCHRFKITVKNEITEYLHRYASILPSEVFEVLYTIDDLLKSNILATPNDHNITINVPLSYVKFDPDDFVSVFSKIGNEILKLRKMIED